MTRASTAVSFAKTKAELVALLAVDYPWVELAPPGIRVTEKMCPELAKHVARGLPVRYGEETLALDGLSQPPEWYMTQPFDGLLGACSLVDSGKFVNGHICLRLVRTAWLRANPAGWDIDELGFVVHEGFAIPLAYAPQCFNYEKDITLPKDWATTAPGAAQPSFEAMADAIRGFSEQAQATNPNPFARTLARRHALQARDIYDREKAFEAFEMLFVYMSLHEELERLRLLMEHLPYALEEDPRMEKFQAQLDKQVGHLKLAGAGTVDWYANGSPSVVVNAEFARDQHCQSPGADRLRWLADECMERLVNRGPMFSGTWEAGQVPHPRVLEMGSVDGFSLFQLMNYAPAIQWEGLEVSKAAVAHGHALDAELGERPDKKLRLHHAPRGFNAWVQEARSYGRHYDAAALFEILEHNGEQVDETLVCAALDVLKPRGLLFISTPCGNWSAFDEHTRDIDLAKDHVNAFTPKRMRKFLERFGREIEVLEVKEVQNANLFEANSWVYALVQKR